MEDEHGQGTAIDVVAMAVEETEQGVAVSQRLVQAHRSAAHGVDYQAIAGRLDRRQAVASGGRHLVGQTGVPRRQGLRRGHQYDRQESRQHQHEPHSHLPGKIRPPAGGQ